jgi:hypothetical protein
VRSLSRPSQGSVSAASEASDDAPSGGASPPRGVRRGGSGAAGSLRLAAFLQVGRPGVVAQREHGSNLPLTLLPASLPAHTRCHAPTLSQGSAAGLPLHAAWSQLLGNFLPFLLDEVDFAAATFFMCKCVACWGQGGAPRAGSRCFDQAIASGLQKAARLGTLPPPLPASTAACRPLTAAPPGAKTRAPCAAPRRRPTARRRPRPRRRRRRRRAPAHGAS